MSIFGTVAFAGKNVFGATATVTMNTALGDLLVVAVQNQENRIPVNGDVSDTIGNTFIRLLASAVTAGSSSAETVEFFYCLSSIGANAANVFSFSGSSYTTIAVWDVPYSGGTVALDTSAGLPATGNDGNVNGTALLTSSFNTAGTDELVFTIGASAPIQTFTGQSLWILDSAGITTNKLVGAQHKAFTSAQTGITSSMTISTSSHWAISTIGFVGTASTHSISGSAGVAGALVTLSGDASATTTADGSGNYSFAGLSDGNYVVTPSLAGYTFAPASHAETLSGSNITGVNFTAKPSYRNHRSK